MTPGEILRKLSTGISRSARHGAEGFTVRKIAARLAAEGLAEEGDFLRLARDREALSRLNIPAASAEAFSSPTPTSSTGASMPGRSWREWRTVPRKVTPEMIAKAESQGLTLQQWVTLARSSRRRRG
jgi:hypothetical protein